MVSPCWTISFGDRNLREGSRSRGCRAGLKDSLRLQGILESCGVRRDEIELVWAAGRDAVMALLEAQSARIDELVERMDELERQAGRSSRNSSLPPSSDSSQARKERPKKQSGRRQGGQKGYPGTHRPMVADPDHVVEHWPSVCAGCGEQIADAGRVGEGDPVAHQVTSDNRQRPRVVQETGENVGRRGLQLPDGLRYDSLGRSFKSAGSQ